MNINTRELAHQIAAEKNMSVDAVLDAMRHIFPLEGWHELADTVEAGQAATLRSVMNMSVHQGRFWTELAQAHHYGRWGMKVPVSFRNDALVRMRNAGLDVAVLADAFGISVRHVYRIVAGAA